MNETRPAWTKVPASVLASFVLLVVALGLSLQDPASADSASKSVGSAQRLHWADEVRDALRDAARPSLGSSLQEAPGAAEDTIQQGVRFGERNGSSENPAADGPGVSGSITAPLDGTAPQRAMSRRVSGRPEQR